MKKFSVFDIIGPRMVGPSSSHTAGAVRIGLVAHALIAGHGIGYVHTEADAGSGGRAVSAKITLYGSFAETGRGHGTDRAIIAGILGVGPDDARVKYSMLLAKSENMDVEVEYSSEETAHPNTARVRVVGDDGRRFEIVGVSIGGGNVEIVEINGMEVSFTGDYPALIAFYRDEPGVIAKVTGILNDEGINVAFMKVFRSAKRQGACMVIETDAPIGRELLERIKNGAGDIEEVCSL